MQSPLVALAQVFLRWIKTHRAGRTGENYTRYINRFIAAVGPIDPADLKPYHLMAWGKTWHEIQAVQRWFNWLVNSAKLLEENPFARVERPRLGKRKRTMDRRAMVRLLRGARPAFRRLLLALRESMARPQEVRALLWEEIVPGAESQEFLWALASGQAVFVLHDYKARERRADPDTPRVIPISARLGRLLVRLHQVSHTTAGVIFNNSKGRPYSRNALRCAMRLLRRRLKLAKDHRGEAIVCYTVRHSVATWATRAGVKDRLLADLMGHTSTRTTARYQHLQREDLQEAIRRISRRASVVPPAGIVRMEEENPKQRPPL